MSALGTGATDIVENTFFNGNKTNTDILTDMGLSFITSTGTSYASDTVVSKINSANSNKTIQTCEKVEVCNESNERAKLLRDFGKMGTLVKNPNIKVDWNKYASHGNERMIERELSQYDINSFIENGKVLSQNNGEKFAYISEGGVAIVDKNRKLITAWDKNHFDNKMVEIVKRLFGN